MKLSAPVADDDVTSWQVGVHSSDPFCVPRATEPHAVGICPDQIGAALAGCHERVEASSKGLLHEFGGVVHLVLATLPKL